MVKVIISTAAALLATSISAGSVTDFPAEVAARIDPTANPCDDFFQYACGTWYKNAVVPPTQSNTDTSFSTLRAETANVVKNILKTKKAKLSEFYDSCMDTKTLEKLGASPLDDDLNQIRDATSVIELINLSAQFSKRGVPTFTKATVDIDVRNPVSSVLYAEQGELTLDRDYFVMTALWPGFEPAYKKYVTTVMELAGKTAAQAAADYAVIVNFERTLAGVHLTQFQVAQAKASDYNPMTFAQAAKKYPLTIGALLNENGLDTGDGWSGAGNKVVLDVLSYFDNAEAFLAAQSRDTLATVLSYRVIHSAAEYLTPAFKTAHWQLFGQALQGQRQEPSREQHCIDATSKHVGDILGEYFLDATFNNATAAYAERMVIQLETSFGQGLDTADWLDDQTRANAKAKLSKFTHLIGGSKNPQLYPTVQFNAKAFLQNRQQINNMDNDAAMNQVGLRYPKTNMGYPPSTVNAYYSPLKNQIIFPAGILQAPFFRGDFDPAQSFGAIGMIIGHEITHGFDNRGRNFDGDGFQKPWWTPTVRAAFDKKAQCISDQYAGFEVFSEVTPGKKLGNVNGTLTLGETIADNGGLKSSFRAYHDYMKTAESKYTKETGEKLFFLSFAQGWCSKNTDRYLEFVMKDSHPPGKFRIYGAVQNNADFARVFQCPANSKMNPTKKCQLWE
ncbi:Aste57867_2919 [Aphanomyces stellatus]|uniref:Aste57867_2919 protein n=1 Tax=Aphanomyces stellatus TaxID=120398 RepID=A0A485KCW1_9STRA|nr:hypothetical protein As57867_002911 [Aphanomyces stellatus]VFT80102.1 Aste57867_2919 [Aphanomyces stellatus]